MAIDKTFHDEWEKTPFNKAHRFHFDGESLFCSIEKERKKYCKGGIFYGMD